VQPKTEKILEGMTTFGRRDFLKTSGQLLLGFSLFPAASCHNNAAPQPSTYSGIPRRPHAGDELIDSWIRLDAEGHVTVLTGKQELGQGIRITLLQMAAEELDVPLEICHIINGDTGQTANEGYTAGSNSVESSGKAIRQAAAEARLYMIRMAADVWGKDHESLIVENGIIKAPSGEELSYWRLLEGKHLTGTVTGEAKLKPHETHRLVGKSIQRRDILHLLKGDAHFVHDLRLPDMVHARICHPPTYHSRLVSFDREEVLKLPGILELVVDGGFVGVITNREYQAVAAWHRIKAFAKWEASSALPEQDNLLEDMLLNAHAPELVEGEARKAKQPEAAVKYEAVYTKPYVMHGTTGPSCAVALLQDGQLTVWTPTQGVYPLQQSLADLLKIDKAQIRCIGTPGSGCYGHNGADDVSAEAALLAVRFPGKPVRLQWMREDEHQWEPYGSAMRIALSAGMDENGKLKFWDSHIWTDTHSSRPNGKGGHYVSARHLADPFRFEKGGYSGGSYRNAAPLYHLPDKRIQLHNYDGPLRTSALRGLGAYGNVFALESFVDEMADLAGQDPVAFRINNLQDQRAIAVLETLKEKTGFSKNPSREDGIGNGVAFAQYKNSASYFAVLATIQLDVKAKTISLLKLTGVIDSGQVINPDGLINQTEGGMIQAASWTLLEAVQYGPEGIMSKDWNSYPIFRTKDVPELEVHVIHRPEEKPLGAGEAAQGPVAAAIANAVFDASGIRVRELPITAEKIDWSKLTGLASS
jgi:nicotinate dehydrogenase subunit B